VGRRSFHPETGDLILPDSSHFPIPVSFLFLLHPLSGAFHHCGWGEFPPHGQPPTAAPVINYFSNLITLSSIKDGAVMQESWRENEKLEVFDSVKLKMQELVSKTLNLWNDLAKITDSSTPKW